MGKAYQKKGPPRETPQILVTAKRLLRTHSQNATAELVGMSSSGLRLALHNAAVRKRRKTPVSDGRGAAQKLTDAQRRRFLHQFTRRKHMGQNPTAPLLWRVCGFKGIVCVKTCVEELKRADQRWRRRARKGAIKEGDAEMRIEWAEENEKTDFWGIAGWTDCYSVSMPTQEAPLRSDYHWCADDETLAPWSTGPKDGRYKGWTLHLFGGMGPDPTKAKTGKLLFLADYIGGGRKRGGWCQELAIELIEKGWLKRARLQNPKKQFIVQHDRDGAFTGPKFQSHMKKRNVKLHCTPSRGGDIAPIEKLWGYVKNLIEIEANNSRKWRYGVKDTPANRRAWTALVFKCVRSVSAAWYIKVIDGMKKRPQMILDAKGGRIKG